MFAGLGTHPPHGTMLCLSVIIHPYTIIETTSLVLINNKVRCLFCFASGIVVSCLLLAEGTETSCLSLDTLVLGRLHEKSHVEIGKLVDDRMK